MKLIKCTPVVIIVVASILISACGGGAGKSQSVEIITASRCGVTGAIPDNCMPEKIEGGSYVTDQNAIHLSGISSVAEDDGCPEPTFFGPVCIPIRPYNYWVSWKNTSNGSNGNGAVGSFLGLPTDPVRWTTYDPIGVVLGLAEPKGIPLQMGPNTIQIATTNSGLKGNAEATIERVADVTPPTVHHVDPEPGGTYGWRIVVYFSEQLDPASIVSAINVIDINALPVPGTSEFDPLKLGVTWLPLSALSPSSAYTARISNVTDWAPNVMIDPYEWTFTTRP